jgi:DNA gyrase subunit A
LVNGEPRRLSLSECCNCSWNIVGSVARRARFELAQARQRIHIVEGLLIALDNLDAVIDTIRRSRTVDTARANCSRNSS